MDINHSLHMLRKYIEQEDFSGYDPYDALNSPILRAGSFGLKYPRIACIQLMKRLPINLRPLLFIRKDYNPKGLGLFLWGYAKLYKLEQKQEYLEKIGNLLDLLDSLKSKGYSGNCWGYNFDWQSRAFYVPKYTPTIVNSSFIGHALIDTYLYTGNKRALDMAMSIRDFLLKDLNRTGDNGTFCFSYTPIDRIAVHNANLLGASFLIRLFKYNNDPMTRDEALSSLSYSMKYQRPNGSWFYADTSYQSWIDSFHTGFNLQSVLYFLEEGYCEEHRQAFKKGVSFYADNFFLEDGTPKYYHDKTYPVDIHSPAQAIVFFSRMGKQYKELTERIIGWMINNMQDYKGYFYFQKTEGYMNKMPYMRWSQAWVFHALTEYTMQREKKC
ncbi:MAG: hypothetical protein A2X59_08095 [Nitrospirae bacterium GWC2_42_7]|nr:MAG: hypothetical protein A2X59_08095 [Nitrospirae bacterium GWC2_42_7]